VAATGRGFDLVVLHVGLTFPVNALLSGLPAFFLGAFRESAAVVGCASGGVADRRADLLALFEVCLGVVDSLADRVTMVLELVLVFTVDVFGQNLVFVFILGLDV
jgi:hypothetical protein